jgi:hypothetical protein
MDGQRLIRLAALAMFGVVGCKSGEFRDDFAPEIQKDCVETVSCAAHGAGFDSSLISACVTRIGNEVGGANISAQQEFIDTVSRCQDLFACNYTTCAFQNVVSGYAATHLQQITYDCQQTVDCRIASKQAVAPTAVMDCISTKSGTLDANVALQTEFDMKFARCSSFAGCSWGSCQ